MRKLLALVLFVTLVSLFAASTPVFGKVKVGEHMMEQYETSHPYASKKGIVYEKEFHYPNAGYIAIHFSEFDLANGDYVQISSPDGQFVYTYKDKGKKVKRGQETLSQFWATHIPGDTAIVRLYGKNNRTANGFVIDQWVRGYEKGYIEAVMAGLEEAELEAICSSDDKEWAKCYYGTTIYDKSKAICRLLIGGSSACTGWLLGSEGHVMTNNHCISTQTDANNTDYEFMAEGATCTTSCSSWGACPGTVAATSGTLVQTDANLDYTLILLPTNITGTYGYLQLRDSLPTVGERIYIPQHPSAYGKMIAVNSDVDGGYAKVYSTDETPCAGGPGDIGYYADTEGGSSGSPVLAYDDHFVVALHHCANCPNRGVPIPSIISDLGANLPNDAIGSSTPDTTPPVISSVGATNVTDDTARIVWNTDESATSVVHYGTTTAYGSTETVTGFATAHTVNLTGLTPNTLYHYKVVSADASSNSAESSDGTFTTLQQQQDPDMYVYSITMSKDSWWIFYRANATITIRDTDGNPVSNATVYVSWSGKTSGSDSGTTNASGQVTFSTGYSLGNGTFTVTVTNVTHGTLQYNSALNNETSDSI
jgi:hypothetical protein